MTLRFILKRKANMGYRSSATELLLLFQINYRYWFERCDPEKALVNQELRKIHVFLCKSGVNSCSVLIFAVNISPDSIFCPCDSDLWPCVPCREKCVLASPLRSSLSCDWCSFVPASAACGFGGFTAVGHAYRHENPLSWFGSHGSVHLFSFTSWAEKFRNFTFGQYLIKKRSLLQKYSPAVNINEEVLGGCMEAILSDRYVEVHSVFVRSLSGHLCLCLREYVMNDFIVFCSDSVSPL